MLNSLSTGVTGMQCAQERMNVIGDNIANVNTTGFKAARMTFEDSFAQTLRSANPGGPASPGSAGVQVGSGVAIAGTSHLFDRGQFTKTDQATDLYINGDGFFLVKDSGGGEYVTRAGEFRIEKGSNCLVTTKGLRVQGYSDSNLTTLGDVTIDPTASKVDIRTNGEIWLTGPDGNPYRRGQILLTAFQNAQALTRIGGNMYTNLDAAGRQPPVAPRTNGLGSLEAGELELSNVDLATEFSNLISTQRAFQANARIISTSDELLQEMINLKR